MKKIVIVLIVLSVFAALVFAGGTQEKAANEARELEIFHWWVGPGEREAADEWFKALHAKYPDIKVIENPVAGGGGV
ncbi:MAG: carbohydrate ABC transporter substrate-binding protein, partial [Spirochaetales bacterium]